MRIMATLALASLLTSVMLPLKADTARDIRSDCNQALREVDTAICADPALVDADTAMAAAVHALLNRSDDDNFRAALRADQRMFLAIRDEAWRVKPNRAMAAARLSEETFDRTQRLREITLHPAAGLEGRWVNAWGSMSVTRAADGTLQMDSDVVDQVAGTWLCGFTGPLVATDADRAEGRTRAGSLHLRREGPLLEVPNDFCDETGPAIAGSMRGVYFRIHIEQ